jgi:hypothetical protein
MDRCAQTSPCQPPKLTRASRWCWALMWRGSVTTHQSSIHGVVSMHGRFCRWRFKASAPTGLSTTFDGGIWAEAVTAEATGEALTIDPALWDEAAERADARLPDDPWQDISWPGSRLCPTQASNGSAARSESRQNSSSKMYCASTGHRSGSAIANASPQS